MQYHEHCVIVSVRLMGYHDQNNYLSVQVPVQIVTVHTMLAGKFEDTKCYAGYLLLYLLCLYTIYSNYIYVSV